MGMGEGPGTEVMEGRLSKEPWGKCEFCTEFLSFLCLGAHSDCCLHSGIPSLGSEHQDLRLTSLCVIILPPGAFSLVCKRSLKTITLFSQSCARHWRNNTWICPEKYNATRKYVIIGPPRDLSSPGLALQQMLCGVQVGRWLVTVFDLRHFWIQHPEFYIPLKIQDTLMVARIPGQWTPPLLTLQRNPGNVCDSLPKALCHESELIFFYQLNPVILGCREETFPINSEKPALQSQRLKILPCNCVFPPFPTLLKTQ